MLCALSRINPPEADKPENWNIELTKTEVSHFFISAEPNQCTGVDCPDADEAKQRRGHYLKLLLNQVVKRRGRNFVTY